MGVLRMIPREHPVVKTVATALRHRCRVKPGAHLLVAVSGGADSVALLRALHILASTRPWHLQLTVAHVQHHLRPDNSAESDARFVKRLAHRLGLPFVRADLDPSHWRGNTEANARRHRYQALHEMALKAGAHCIVTAHHADDQLETLLMRLLRGTSVHGLSGIAWRRPLRITLPERLSTESAPSPLILLRPLLDVDRAELRDFLKSLRQRWHEDATNDDLSRWRACLRAQVVPVLHALRPGVAHTSTRMTHHFRALAILLHMQTRLAQSHLHTSPDGASITLMRSTARDLPSLVLADLLRHALQQLGVPADQLGQRMLSPLIRAVRDHTGGKRQFQFQKQISVNVTRDNITLTTDRCSRR
ncbi:MAG: tRNA lysidine(34) synthetase TilS [Phycisphaerales bacterium]|nr:tRNA lysidine(34) synthetase TilS [Phycisphaerales bacterium]